MKNGKQTKVEELKKDEDVRRELEQTAENKPSKLAAVDTRQKFWLGTYVLLLLGFAAAYLVISLDVFELEARFALAERVAPLLQRLSLGAIAVVLLLLAVKVVKVYVIGRIDNRSARFNLERIVDLVAGITIVLIGISLLFANWYTTVVSLGLISLVLGLALQTVISSFFAWIYILVKVPYKVGDRIKIGDASGDVIDVSYLDTTLWEFGGQHLSTDHPSGRIIKFPNSKVLNSAVYNYSWPLFPYIWNDIKFQIAYQSDLEFVAETMRSAAAEEVGEAMMERIRTYRELLAQTPVDQLEVREHPAVVFRVGDNTWIEAICRYLVEPRMSGPVKTRLVKKMLDRLNAEPGKVMFPKGDSR
jgi:small-conductance mechanosensitive channel